MIENVNPGIFAGIAIVLAIGWLIVRAKGGPPKKFLARELFFTVKGPVYMVEAESVTGVLLTELYGGQKEDPAAVVAYRRGRLWRSPGERDANSMRKRDLIYVTRQHDPRTLNLHGLFTGRYLSAPLLKTEVLELENFAVDLAISKAARKTTTRDTLTRRMAWTALIAVALGGLSLLTVTLTASLRMGA